MGHTSWESSVKLLPFLSGNLYLINTLNPSVNVYGKSPTLISAVTYFHILYLHMGLFLKDICRSSWFCNKIHDFFVFVGLLEGGTTYVMCATVIVCLQCVCHMMIWDCLPSMCLSWSEGRIVAMCMESAGLFTERVTHCWCKTGEGYCQPWRWYPSKQLAAALLHSL